MMSSNYGVLQQTKFCSKWKIERFFADCEKIGDFYTSPVFLIPYGDKITKWFLQIFPRNHQEEFKDYVSVFLHFESEKVSEVLAEYKLSIVSESRVDAIESLESEIETFKGPNQSWGWSKFELQDYIRDTRNGILINDTLTILCEITFPQEAENVAKKSKEYNNLLDKNLKRLQDYEELLESNSFSDVTFILQNKEIHLHKAILSCRNSYFKNMFENETNEERPRKKQRLANDPVKITDVNYEIMMEVFRFIYSGKVVNIDKIAKRLLIAADKCKVTELKVLCEITLSKTIHTELTMNTVIEYLKLVRICETMHLKTPVIEFAAAHGEEVIKIPEFQNISRIVMFQIMQKMIKKD